MQMDSVRLELKLIMVIHSWWSGLHVVYKKDIEDLNQAMAECSNNSIIPYKSLDIPHYFDNSAVVVEGNQKDWKSYWIYGPW